MLHSICNNICYIYLRIFLGICFSYLKTFLQASHRYNSVQYKYLRPACSGEGSMQILK